MGICLNMIVRNEAENLPRLFASLEGQIDFFVISDTGSTDDTPSVIRQLSTKHGIPGIVTHNPWSDFATNRNFALQDALDNRLQGRHSCDWLLILDADEELCVRQHDWKSALQSGISYSMLVRGARLSASRLSLLWWDGADWYWKGPVHNELNSSDESHHFDYVEGVYIRTHPFRGAKSSGFSSGIQKAAHDASIMDLELTGVQLTESNAHRFFQWAHVCFLSGSLLQAAEIFSQLAVDIKLSNGLRYASAVLAGRCSLALEMALKQGPLWFDLARSICPDRREDLYYKALMIAPHDQTQASELLEMASGMSLPSGNIFYLEHELYEWRIEYQQIIWSFAKGDLAKAIKGADTLLKSDLVPEPERGFLCAIMAESSLRSMMPDQSAETSELTVLNNFPNPHSSGH